MFKEITPQQAQEFKKNKNVMFIDVRTIEEWKEKHIESLHIPLDDEFEKKIAELGREKVYIVFCRSGNRSGIAQDIMKGLGFKNVLNVIGSVFG